MKPIRIFLAGMFATLLITAAHAGSHETNLCAHHEGDEIRTTLFNLLAEGKHLEMAEYMQAVFEITSIDPAAYGAQFSGYFEGSYDSCQPIAHAGVNTLLTIDRLCSDREECMIMLVQTIGGEGEQTLFNFTANPEIDGLLNRNGYTRDDMTFEDGW